MKVSALHFLFLLSFSSSQSQEITLAITNCNVITMTSKKVLHDQTILISHDKIVKVIPARQWINPGKIETIDGTGKYIIPALTDMHIHVNKYSNWAFELLLAYGVTTIRVMAGSETVLKWRDSVNKDLKMAPDIHTASELIDGAPPYWGDLHEGPVVEKTDSLSEIIDDQMQKGYEFIKLYNRLDPVVYKSILEICFRKKIKVTGHIPIRLEKKDFLSEHTGEIEHLSGYARLVSNVDTISAKAIARYSDIAYDLESSQSYSLSKMKSAARRTKAFGIWNCPTLVIQGIRTDTLFCRQLGQSAIAEKLKPVLAWWTTQGYTLTPEEKNQFEFKKQMVRELNKNKAFLLAGTDCPVPWLVPGLSLHQELKYLVQAGLSNYEALKTATVNPAIWFGSNYNKGTIESGKRADLIILSSNPLIDITNTQMIVSVIFKGRIVSPN